MFIHFTGRDALHASAVYAMVILSVRLSVHPSVTFLHSDKLFYNLYVTVTALSGVGYARVTNSFHDRCPSDRQ